MTGLSHSNPVIYLRMTFIKQMSNQGTLLLPPLQSFCIVLRKKSKLLSSAHEALHSLPPTTIPIPAHVFHRLAFRHPAPCHSNVLPVSKTQLKIPFLSPATPTPISVSLIYLSYILILPILLIHSFNKRLSAYVCQVLYRHNVMMIYVSLFPT